MSKERPRLERVLRVRRLEEEISRDKFLACDQVARRAEEVADGIGAEIARAQVELSETRLRQRIPTEDMLMAQNMLESLDANLTEQRRRVRQLDVEAAEKRGHWEQARQDMRALERIEERLRDAELEEDRRREAREMDEVALRRTPGAAEPAPAGPQSSQGDRAVDEEAVDPSGAEPR